MWHPWTSPDASFPDYAITMTDTDVTFTNRRMARPKAAPQTRGLFSR